MNARYVRVSSNSQNDARQIARHHSNEMLFIDKVSGTIPFNKRKQAQALIAEIEKGNIKMLSASSIDRLGRDTLDVLRTIQFLTEKGVTLTIDNLAMSSLIAGKENPTFSLIVSVLVNITSMELSSLRERMLEGIAEAKKKGGVYKGRAKGTRETHEQILAKYPNAVRYLKMGKSIRDVAGRCKLSVGTVQKVRTLCVAQ